MFNLGDSVRILENDITVDNVETIDRIQYYNRGRTGIVFQINEDICLITTENNNVIDKYRLTYIPIRLSGIEKV